MGLMMLGKSIIFLALLVLFEHQVEGQSSGLGFAARSGNRFVANGKPVYLNGLNGYWMMYMAGDPSTIDKVTATFQDASKNGMNIARTWAFRDGDLDRPLQSAPGSYNEVMFKALDFVISEANKHGVYLILSLVNNLNDYGGKKQYVEWGKQQGQQLSNEDDFYTNPLVKSFYKNHVKTVLTRVNKITGVAYKDDPTIFAWELMNEPQCQTDLSGKTLQDWIIEMAAHVKSIDSKHLLEIGLEGFYGQSIPERIQYNPRGQVFGTDFISNNQVSQIDFATIHVYAEQCCVSGIYDMAAGFQTQVRTEEEQATLTSKWFESHVQDSNSVLQKPLLLGEFGKSSRLAGYSLDNRNAYFQRVYNEIYTSASSGGPFAGGLYWQAMSSGMDSLKDGYEVILEESPSTATIIAQQSTRLSNIT